jgi:release factor glutamine methyltransferase
MSCPPNDERVVPKRETRPTYAHLLRKIRNEFREAGIPDWKASADWLVMDATGCSRTELFSSGDRVASLDEVDRLDSWTRRRLAREPVQYIVGYTEFFGLRIRVDPSVLIPRPETELLVERVVEAAADLEGPLRILDVCTGSGCIALAVASSLPDASVVATDYAEDVLAVARRNARDLGLDVALAKWDVLGQRAPLDGEFSIIVSNPPYIPEAEIASIMPEVASYEPHAALFVTGDPLCFYRAILSSAADLLSEKGFVFFEVNPTFAEEVEKLLWVEFGSVGREQDLAGFDRIVWGRRGE